MVDDMSSNDDQCRASSNAGVGDVGLCCADLGPETCEADCGERCNKNTRRGWAFEGYSRLQHDRTRIAPAAQQKVPSVTTGGQRDDAFVGSACCTSITSTLA